MLRNFKTYCFTIFLLFGLVQINVSGQFNVVSKDDQNKELLELSIFPNPALEYFTLDTNHSIKKITINNIVGKQVKSFMGNDENKYDVSELKKGIYIVRIFDNKDQLVKALRLSKS